MTASIHTGDGESYSAGISGAAEDHASFVLARRLSTIHTPTSFYSSRAAELPSGAITMS